MPMRFTIDGSPALEERLQNICDKAQRETTTLIGPMRLAALVLGGGYGRGEGGVLKGVHGDEPYNDLDFYIFLRGNRLWQEHRCGKKILELAERLSAEAGLQVEFKIESAEGLRHRAVTMFSHDLIAGHRILCGEKSIFHHCDHHLDARAIPLSEATRLMFNRCSGLLLARELLQKRSIEIDDADFIGRNLAKMQLALGDSVLAARGEYHWSALARHRRLQSISQPGLEEIWAQIQADHAAGLEFKLHPRRAAEARAAFDCEHKRLASLAKRLWLWIESRRLKQDFCSPSQYALSELDKCPGTSAWRNYFLSLRAFGPKAMLEAMSRRYPRERLFNALALLLWDAEAASQPPLLRRLQKALHTDASDWSSLVNAFKQIWSCYG